MADINPRIEIRDLTKIYPLSRSESTDALGKMISGTTNSFGSRSSGKIAVDCVSLSIGMGERLGIVGRNGAGKSTLLHMIAGLTAPTSGMIKTSGHVTAVMTLGVGLREELSGRENIYIDGEIQGKSRKELEPVIEDIVAFAELGEFIDYPVRTYSTGMKSRLAFAMISYLDPEILVIDEALSAGDAVFSAKATKKIREICAKGKIVIIVSHGMGAIVEMCDRCLWMDNGKVIMDGSPEQVTKAYIDAVRSEDEARLMERFKQLVSTQAFESGWAIEHFEAYHVGDQAPRALLEAGQSVAIRAKIVAPECDASTYFRFSVTRLDGLSLMDEKFPVQDFRKTDSDFLMIELRMEPLVLGVGVYRIGAEVEHRQTIKAARNRIIEVYALRPPTGGKPALLYPYSIRTEAMKQRPVRNN